MFAGMKKVKKTKKVVAFDELDVPSEPSSSPAGGKRAAASASAPEVAPETAHEAAKVVEESPPAAEPQVDAVRPVEENAKLTLPETDDLDFSLLVRIVLALDYVYRLTPNALRIIEKEEEDQKGRLGSR